jgi:hypothetical protein
MKTVLLAAVLGLAACGGSQTDQLFKGDPVVAEIRDGVPFCGAGVSGPTIKDSVATTSVGNNGVPFQSSIHECSWTCGSINGIDRAYVYVIFFTRADGTWAVDPHADTIGAVAPAICP